jgi:Na+-driven multidrug efflux pump
MSAITSMMSIYPLFAGYAYGLTITETVFVSNAIGADDVKFTKTYTRSAIAIIIAVSFLVCLIMLIMFLLRNFLGSLCTIDPTIIVLFPTFIMALCFFLICNSLHLTCLAILKGLGTQQTATIYCLFSPAVIGLQLDAVEDITPTF